MSRWVCIEKDAAHVKRERAKARVLRAGAWWRGVIARGECRYCGGKFPPERLTMDHVIPVARGGRSDKSNVVPACAACNKSKRALTPAEMILDELGLGGDADGAEDCGGGAP